VLLGKLNNSRVEGVLGRAVEVGDALLDGSNAVKHRGGEGSVVLNAVLKVVKCVDFGQKEHLSVGGPEHDNLVVAGLAVTDVLAKFLNELFVVALHNIVSTVGLVSGNEIGVKDSLHGLDGLKVALKLVDESGLKHVGALGGFVQVEVADVPTADVEVDGVDHGEKLLDGLEDVGERAVCLIEVETNVSGGALGEGTIEVSLLLTSLGGPGESTLVSDDTGCEGGTVVTTKADEHDTKLGDSLVSFDGLLLDDRAGLLGFGVVEGEAVLVVDLDMRLSLGAGDSGEGGAGLHLLELEGACGSSGDDRGLLHCDEWGFVDSKI
jgi:hypothetical protein